MPGISLRSLLVAIAAALLPLSGAAQAQAITRPGPEQLRKMPDGYKPQLVMRRIMSVNGKREGVHFAKGQRIEIRGMNLSNGDIGSLQGWIIGDNRGGSMLEIINATSQLIVARPLDVAGANSVWPTHSGGSPLPTQTIKVLIRDDNQPGRDLTISLRNSYYACIRGEQVCGGR